MSVKTFVWWFNCEWAQIIDNLSDNGVIDRKGWLAHLWHRRDKLLKKKNILKENTFYSTRWSKVFDGKISQYQDSVPFNPEVYQKVYEKLYFFIDQYSRHDRRLHKRPLHYYINQFNLLYNFFYSIFFKEEIELVLFGCIPHLGPESILYEIAKAMNIRTIILHQSPFPGKLFHLECIEEYGDFTSMSKQPGVPYEELEKKFFVYHFYMRSVKTFRFSLLQMIARTLRKPHILLEELSYNYQRYLRVARYKRSLRKLIAPTDYGKKYVYFPLHMQPELSTSVMGGVFNDQLLALELLSRKLPEDWVIHVKENPKQSDFMRDEAFFERLKRIGKVRVVPIQENTYKLIEHSQFVATITGTAGWEAICGGKPTLIFGKTWYQNFEGVFKWNPDFDIRSILDCRIDHEKLEQDYNELLSKSVPGVVAKDYCCLVKDYDEPENIRQVTELLTKLIRQTGENASFSTLSQKKAA